MDISLNVITGELEDEGRLTFTLPTAPYWAKNMPREDSTTLAGTAARIQGQQEKR
jgi:hypothetical protein